MHDSIQQGLQTLASHNVAARDALIVCAVAVVYVMAAAWLVVIARCRAWLTLGAVVRLAALGVLAYAASKVLTSVVADPRPYLVEHVRPLIPVARDNGFPSDHTLLAATLTATLWWINRRALAAFAIGTLLVMAGRLGIGAHHTIDVLGAVGIVVTAALVVAALSLPAAWDRPLLPPRWRGGSRPTDNRTPRSVDVTSLPDSV